MENDNKKDERAKEQKQFSIGTLKRHKPNKIALE